MAVTETTKAARALEAAKRKLAKVQGNEDAAIAKATAKAQAKYGVKLTEVAQAVAAAKKFLQALVAAE